MNASVDWATYLKVIADGASGAVIAGRLGIADTTVSRWLLGTAKPRPHQVVTIAREFNVHPLQALIAAGYLEPDEVDLAAITPRKLQLREFTELEIAEEMVRRIAEGESQIIESPLDGNHPAMQQLMPSVEDTPLAPVRDITPPKRERGVANEAKRDRSKEIRRVPDPKPKK